MDLHKRQDSEKRGRWAEHLAALWLQLCGYKIIARRQKTPFGEIDLIACKPRQRRVIFAEVKYRRDKTALPASLTPQAQKRITQAAHYITSRTPAIQPFSQRFDLILISPLGPLPLGHIQHLKDGWRTY